MAQDLNIQYLRSFGACGVLLWNSDIGYSGSIPFPGAGISGLELALFLALVAGWACVPREPAKTPHPERLRLTGLAPCYLRVV